MNHIRPLAGLLVSALRRNPKSYSTVPILQSLCPRFKNFYRIFYTSLPPFSWTTMNDDYEYNDVDILTTQLAELSVADRLRRQIKMVMPDPMLVVQMEQLSLAILDRRNTGSRQMLNRKIVEFFGVPTLVMAKVWELLVEYRGPLPNGSKKCHLLWTLHFLKTYSSSTALGKGVNCVSPKTFQYWTLFIIFELKELVPEVVSSTMVSVNVFVNQMTKLF
jgi:hypothetical protein